MKITFVLPHYDVRVSGGYRVVFEYANRLTARGNEVTVMMFAPGLRLTGHERWFSRSALRQVVKRVRHRGRIPWMQLDKRVSMQIRFSDDPVFAPPGDVIVATAWLTAGYVRDAPPNAGSKVYFIQHYEVWDGPEELVNETWKFPLRKIVIARWLADLSVRMDPSSPPAYVPNAIDHNVFKVENPIVDRGGNHVGMLWHPNSSKGARDGLAALEQVHREDPSIRVTLFGYPARPAEIPSWIEYRARLKGQDLVNYYNSLDVFLHTSLSEGWGLTPAEAMACGVAIVATDNPGVLDYAVAGKTALVVPRGNSSAMAQAIVELIRSPEERLAFAEAGVASIQKFDWDSSTSAFEAVLRDTANG